MADIIGKRRYVQEELLAPATKDTDSASLGDVRRVVSNPNILINTDFRNPINQRGATTASGTQFILDRWRLSAGTVALGTAENGGTRLIFPNGGNANFIQWIESPHLFSDKTLTFSVRARASGNGVASMYIFAVGGGGSTPLRGITTEWSTVVDTRHFGPDVSSLAAAFRFTSSSASDWVEIEWAKLEEGSVATAWQVPDPAAELARCQRYCQVYTSTAALNSLGIGIVTSARGVQIPMSFSQMRATPTVSLTGAINVYTANSTHTPATIGWANASSRSGQFSLVWSADEFSSTNLPLRALLTANSKLVFDAEI